MIEIASAVISAYVAYQEAKAGNSGKPAQSKTTYTKIPYGWEIKIEEEPIEKPDTPLPIKKEKDIYW